MSRSDMARTGEPVPATSDPVIASMEAIEATENPYQPEEEITMRTHWRVEKVTETPGRTIADLARIEWFKPNPERIALDQEYDAYQGEHTEAEVEAKYLGYEWPEEFIDAEPGEEGAESYEPGGETMTLDITNGPDLHAGDNVAVSVEAVALVST